MMPNTRRLCPRRLGTQTGICWGAPANSPYTYKHLPPHKATRMTGLREGARHAPLLRTKAVMFPVEPLAVIGSVWAPLSHQCPPVIKGLICFLKTPLNVYLTQFVRKCPAISSKPEIWQGLRIQIQGGPWRDQVSSVCVWMKTLRLVNQLERLQIISSENKSPL